MQIHYQGVTLLLKQMDGEKKKKKPKSAANLILHIVSLIKAHFPNNLLRVLRKQSLEFNEPAQSKSKCFRYRIFLWQLKI